MLRIYIHNITICKKKILKIWKFLNEIKLYGSASIKY